MPAPKIKETKFTKEFMKKVKKQAKDLSIIDDQHPDSAYEFTEEIGRGKNSIVMKVRQMATGTEYAAKIMYWYDDVDKNGNPSCNMEELENMKDINTWDNSAKKYIPHYHESFFMQKYLVLILDLCEGPTILLWGAERKTYNENHVSNAIRQLCEILCDVHGKNYAHLDLRPTNIRMVNDKLKLLDWDSARKIPNRKAGQVVDVTGDTEFCPPEMLNYDKVFPSSDMWTLGVNMYVMLTGISPFYHEMKNDNPNWKLDEEEEIIPDENKITQSVVKVEWDKDFSDPAWSNVSSDAKDFIKAIFHRQPEKRLTAEQALSHPFLDESKANLRKAKSLEAVQSAIRATEERLLDEEIDDWVECSGKLCKFGDEPNHSSDEEEQEDEE